MMDIRCRNYTPTAVFLPANGKTAAQIFVWPGNDLDADDFADARRRGAAGVDGGLDRRHVADHQGRDHAAADLLPADQRHVGGLEHGVAGLDQRHQTLGLDHAKGFHVGSSH